MGISQGENVGISQEKKAGISQEKKVRIFFFQPNILSLKLNLTRWLTGNICQLLRLWPWAISGYSGTKID